MSDILRDLDSSWFSYVEDIYNCRLFSIGLGHGLSLWIPIKFNYELELGHLWIRACGPNIYDCRVNITI